MNWSVMLTGKLFDTFNELDEGCRILHSRNLSHKWRETDRSHTYQIMYHPWVIYEQLTYFLQLGNRGQSMKNESTVQRVRSSTKTLFPSLPVSVGGRDTDLHIPFPKLLVNYRFTSPVHLLNKFSGLLSYLHEKWSRILSILLQKKERKLFGHLSSVTVKKTTVNRKVSFPKTKHKRV